MYFRFPNQKIKEHKADKTKNHREAKDILIDIIEVQKHRPANGVYAIKYLNPTDFEIIDDRRLELLCLK